MVKARFLATVDRCRDKFCAINQVVFANVEEAALLTVRDIYYISTMSGKDKNYVLIHDRLSEHSALLEEEKGIKIRMTMNEVEQLLAGKGFYRCQSGYLVNWAYVKRIYTEKSDKLVQNKVLLVDGDWRQTLPVSPLSAMIEKTSTRTHFAGHEGLVKLSLGEMALLGTHLCVPKGKMQPPKKSLLTRCFHCWEMSGKQGKAAA